MTEAATWEVVRQGLLTTEPRPPADLLAVDVAGLYAWWDRRGVLTDVYPDGCPPVAIEAPIYVGIAKTTLGERVAEMHLKTTRFSTLRRSLATLLHKRLELNSHLAVVGRNRLAMDAEGESILTAWMMLNLEVTWVARQAPTEVEKVVVGAILPPLNDHFSPSPQRPYLREAREAVRVKVSTGRLPN